MKQIKIGTTAAHRRIEGIKAYADVLCITAQNLDGEAAAKIINGVVVGGITPNWTNTIVGTAAGDCYVELTEAELAALSEGDTVAWSCAAVTGQLRVPPAQIVSKYASDADTTAAGRPTLLQIEASTVLAKEATVAARPTNPLLTNDARLPATIISTKADVDAVGAMIQGTGEYTVTIQLYRTATTTPIPDATITVMNSGDVTFLTALTADDDGRATMARNAGTFKLRISCPGYTFTVPETLTVTGSGTYTFYGTGVAIPAPPAENMQNIYGNVRRLNWAVATGEVIYLVIDNTSQVVNGALIQTHKIPATVDSNSQFLFSNIPCGAQVRLETPHHGNHKFTVDDRNDTVDVAEYL